MNCVGGATGWRIGKLGLPSLLLKVLVRDGKLELVGLSLLLMDSSGLTGPEGLKKSVSSVTGFLLMVLIFPENSLLLDCLPKIGLKVSKDFTGFFDAPLLADPVPKIGLKESKSLGRSGEESKFLGRSWDFSTEPKNEFVFGSPNLLSKVFVDFVTVFPTAGLECTVGFECEEEPNRFVLFSSKSCLPDFPCLLDVSFTMLVEGRMGATC